MAAKGDIITYEENFFFRKRKHTLTEQGIRTQQSDFFTSSDILTPMDSLGYLLQYRSELSLQDIFISAVFLIIGVKGLSKGMNDDVAFAICIILIAVAMYWLVRLFFNLEHIGSFYFSSGTEKAKSGFEIKSRYPASAALDAFLKELRKRQKMNAMEKLIQDIVGDVDLKHYESESNYLKCIFSMEELEFKAFLSRIIERHQSVNNSSKRS